MGLKKYCCIVVKINKKSQRALHCNRFLHHSLSRNRKPIKFDEDPPPLLSLFIWPLPRRVYDTLPQDDPQQLTNSQAPSYC